MPLGAGNPVPERDRPASETPVVDELEIQSHIVREDGRPGADDDRQQHLVHLVDEPRAERLCGEGGAADDQLTQNMTLDGRFDWAEPDEEVHRYANAELDGVSTHLYG